jgi:hypothetical protein
VAVTVAVDGAVAVGTAVGAVVAVGDALGVGVVRPPWSSLPHPQAQQNRTAIESSVRAVADIEVPPAKQIPDGPLRLVREGRR